MAIRFIALLGRQLFQLLLLRCRTTRSKDIELLVLRQEGAILRRQMNRPKVRPEERMVLSVLQGLRPAWERTSSLVTPDTLRLLGSSQRPWMNTTAVGPEAFALSTCSSSSVVVVASSSWRSEGPMKASGSALNWSPGL